MEKSELNGEKFVRRAARAWRLRRQRHIGSSCDDLNMLALHHARLLSRSGAAAFGRSTSGGAASGYLLHGKLRRCRPVRATEGPL